MEPGLDELVPVEGWELGDVEGEFDEDVDWVGVFEGELVPLARGTVMLLPAVVPTVALVELDVEVLLATPGMFKAVVLPLGGGVIVGVAAAPSPFKVPMPHGMAAPPG